MLCEYEAPAPDELWYDDDAALRDLEAIRDARSKEILAEVLPESRRNGELVAPSPPRRRGDVVEAVFPYRNMGIALVLATTTSSSHSSLSHP